MVYVPGQDDPFGRRSVAFVKSMSAMRDASMSRSRAGRPRSILMNMAAPE
jgi:hypothetical protein